jgi:hypothetical protein
MIRLGVLLAAVGALIFLWHECGEDLGVFCYRIGSGAFTGSRSRALVPVPVRNSNDYSVARNNPECLTPSFASSTRFLTPTDSGS